jgi:hypothetical protein
MSAPKIIASDNNALEYLAECPTLMPKQPSRIPENLTETYAIQNDEPTANSTNPFRSQCATNRQYWTDLSS